MRLFLAINFEDEIKEEIAAIIDFLRPYATQGRFVHKDNLHLTLEFLGEIEETRVKDLKEILNHIEHSKFQLKFTELGHFKTRKGRIYWLGLEHNEVLISLQASLRQKLREKKFNVDSREFSPHNTIGRNMKFKNDLNLTPINEQIKKLETTVEKINLMESKFVNGKLVYSVVHTKYLK